MKASPRKATNKDAALAVLADLTPTRADFFVTASKALAHALGYRWAGVALLDAGGETATIIALVEREREAPGLRFALRGTPCGALYAGAPGNGHAYFCANVQEDFPAFALFGKDVARSYRGACFRDDAGRVLGHVFVVDDAAHQDDDEARTFLALLAQRVGAEWVRAQSEARLRAMFDTCQQGILITRETGELLDINPAALEMLRWERRWVMRHGLPEPIRTALGAATLRPGGEAHGAFPYERGDGERRHFEFTVADLRLGDQLCRQYQLVDVTARTVQDDLRRHYEAIMQHSQDFLALVSRDFRYLAVSRRYGETFQRAIGDIVGRNVSEIHGEEVFRDAIRPNLERCLQGEDILWQHPIDSPYGARMVESHLIPCRDDSGAVVGVVVNARDVTDAFHLSRRLAHQASHDDLTQLPNRREFESRLADALHAAQRGDSAHALCYIDLDQFKVVNDTVGHRAGDELLRQVAALLQTRVRGTDTLARLGGDEFGLLLHDCTLAQARPILDELLNLLDGFRFRWEGRTFQITASAGMVPVTAHAHSVQQLLSSADIACYTAKDLGRNRAHVYEMQDADLLRRQRELRFTGQLRAAVQEGRFVLFHQPVARLSDLTGRPAYDEILVRMLGEHGELVQPGAFVGAAERFGLMRHVDEWVIRTVLRDYQALFASLGAPRVAINLSGTSLADESFLKFVRREIDVSRFDPAKLCFEITETAAINNLARVRDFIGDMRGLGCLFALDDFGSGLSSFSYLKQFPVDYIKIDGVFVRAMEKDRLDRALVDAIGGVARALGIGAIAEHLESDGALAALRESGIEYAQGYLIDAPRQLRMPH